VETFCYGGEWGVKTNTNAAENDRMNRNPLILRQTPEKERLHVLQVVDLSVLAAASFRIVITLSLS